VLVTTLDNEGSSVLSETDKLTYEAWLQLPEIRRRYEVIDGELRFIPPGPTPDPQRRASNLFLHLAPFIRERQLGEVFFAPLDVLITRQPLRTRQPDLLFVSTQRREIIGSQHITAGPDLVIEILSSSNTPADLEAKLADYWSIDVQECWLVSPSTRTVEVLRWTTHGFERTGLYGPGEVLVSHVLPDLRVSVTDIW